MDGYTIYTGSATGGPNTSPKPTTGFAPNVVIPADGYVLTSAVFQQQEQTLADYCASLTATFSQSPQYDGYNATNLGIVPQVKYKSGDGYARYTNDHNGYPLGHRLFELKENWVGSTGGTLSSNGALTGFQRWNVGFSGTSVGVTSLAPFAAYPTPLLDIQYAHSIDGYSMAYSVVPIVMPQANEIVVVEFDAYCHNVAGNCNAIIGLSQNLTTTLQPLFSPEESNYMAVWLLPSSGNMRAVTQNNVTTLQTSTSTSTPQETVTRFRIELVGANCFGGAKCVMYVNGVGFTNTGSSVPFGQLMYFVAIAKSEDTVTSRQLYLGGVTVMTNRFTSADGL